MGRGDAEEAEGISRISLIGPIRPISLIAKLCVLRVSFGRQK